MGITFESKSGYSRTVATKAMREYADVLCVHVGRAIMWPHVRLLAGEPECLRDACEVRAERIQSRTEDTRRA